jgi:hypothetical protein
MKKITILISILFFFLPSVAGAQSGTTTDEGVSISSTFIEQVRNLDGEEVGHASVSLHLGVRKRFDTSPADVAELEITPSIVLNDRLLELYVRKIVLTEPIKVLSVGESAVSTTIKGSARLLGFIPVQIPYKVTANFDTKLTDVTTHPAAWWGFLAATQSSDDIATKIHTQLKGVRYLSRIQLRALILGAIVDTVTS